MNPIGWVQGLNGGTLIAVICGLMFLEEVGLPLPFAPGDIVLAIGGIAIAGGRVNPAMFVPAVALTIIVGAALGREIFALLGWRRLMVIADPLHARGPLERAAALLQRGGWRAVFTARLIPGLRVYTTQVAGVSQVPRGTFLSGLVPSTVVYLGAFVGLGAAVGRPVLALIHTAENQLLLAIGLGFAALLLFLLTRAPVRRTLASLQAAGWTGPLKFSLDSVGLILILACLGLNFAGRAIAITFHLPLFLDSIGTVLAGVVAGPWIGGSVGFISNLVSSNTIDPIAAPYSIVSFAIGFAAGLGRYLGWQKRLSGWVTLWLVCFTVASVTSTPLNFLFSGGKSGVGIGDSIYAGLSGVHLPGFLAAFIGEAAVDLPDKLLTVLAALLIAQGLPQPGVSTAADLDLGEAFTFVVRSPRWVRKLLACAACLLFGWLIVPFLLMLGYLMDVARAVRAGSRELPPWDSKWRKIREGFKFGIALAIWYAPAIVLAVPGAVVDSLNQPAGHVTPGAITATAAILNAASSVWGVVVLLLEAAIISQYIDRGLGAALNVSAVLRRLRVNLGLTIVVGVLVVVLSTIGLIGLAAFGVGVLLTFPYASYVASYLVGQYARLTDRKPDHARFGQPVGV